MGRSSKIQSLLKFVCRSLLGVGFTIAICAVIAPLGAPAESPSVTAQSSAAEDKIRKRVAEMNLIIKQENAIINGLTRNRTVPVTQGSRAYYACLKSQKRIQAATAELQRMTAELQRIKAEASKSNPFGDNTPRGEKPDTSGRRIIGQLYEEVLQEYGKPESVEKNKDGTVEAMWEKGTRIVRARFGSNRICDALSIFSITGLTYADRDILYKKYRAGRETTVTKFHSKTNNENLTTTIYTRANLSSDMEAFNSRSVPLASVLSPDKQTMVNFELYLSNDTKPLGGALCLKEAYLGLRKLKNLDDL